MALKEFGNSNPRSRDKDWKEDIPMAELPKLGEWYTFRLVGGVFTYANHWIDFVNASGQKKTYPVNCANWDRDSETPSLKNGCPACDAGIKTSVKYMLNVISRKAQDRGDDDPIRALEIPPTVMRLLMDLRNLNKVKGEAYYVNHPLYGIDVHLQKKKTAKGIEWHVQRGERTKLTPEELELELVDFEEYWIDPDIHKCRADLTRHGYFDSPSSKNRDDDDDDISFSKKAHSGKSPSKRKRPDPDDDFDDDDEDDEEEAPAPRRKKRKRPVSDEEEAPAPRRKKRKRPAPPVEDDDDEDDEEEAPAPRRKKRKRPAPPVEDDDEDEDDDFDFDV